MRLNQLAIRVIYRYKKNMFVIGQKSSNIFITFSYIYVFNKIPVGKNACPNEMERNKFKSNAINSPGNLLTQSSPAMLLDSVYRGSTHILASVSAFQGLAVSNGTACGSPVEYH
jgi:hypothetical protein